MAAEPSSLQTPAGADSNQVVARAIRVGVWLLPVYGLLTFIATFTHQPDMQTDFAAYARYISSRLYLVEHLVGSIGGTILAILGVIALCAYLMRGPRTSAVIAGLVLSVVGNALILTVFGASTFGSPAVGKEYLAGNQDIVDFNNLMLGTPLVVTALVGTLCYSAGAIVLGIVIWRTRPLPAWSGVLYAASGPFISVLGLIYGPSQTLGAALLIVGSVWIARTIQRRGAATRTLGTSSPPANAS